MTSDVAAMRTLAAQAHNEASTYRAGSQRSVVLQAAALQLEMAAERIEALEAQLGEQERPVAA